MFDCCAYSIKILVMHKFIAIAFILFAVACGGSEEGGSENDSTTWTYDTMDVTLDENPHIHGKDTVDVYSNKRFKNVYVEKLGDTSYRVMGQAQVFEAAYSWYLTDGEKEISSGYGTTDAGAPEFGNFSFVLNTGKRPAGKALHLVLFESSAKDGSRQHELPIRLPD
jgi:hypothetical protein